MGLKRCLFGCLLALAGAGTAMGATTQDPTTQHAAIDSGSHDGGGGDASSSGRDCILPANSSSDSTDTDDSGGGGAPAVHPRASHHSSLGWQSLLPGSIQ